MWLLNIVLLKWFPVYNFVHVYVLELLCEIVTQILRNKIIASGLYCVFSFVLRILQCQTQRVAAVSFVAGVSFTNIECLPHMVER